MIRSVVFDWGGVISSAGIPDDIYNTLSAITGRSKVGLKLKVDPLLQKFKRSFIDEAQLWLEIERLLGRRFAANERSVWIDVDLLKPEPAMQTFAERLQAEGYDVSILSNTFPPSAQAIRAKGWYDNFDTVILSSEVGLAKPEEKIYELLLEKTGFRAAETIFIDDQEKCLLPAQRMGMQTVLAKNPGQIIREITTLLA